MGKKSKADRVQTLGWTAAEKWWWSIGITAYVFIAIAAIVYVPDRWVETTQQGSQAASGLSSAQLQSAVAQARQSVLLAAGGGLALFTLLVTLRRDAISKGRAQQERNEQVSQQFTDAIGQLADADSTSIRLGGIYALERIATDSASHALGVLAVLAQVVRGDDREQGQNDDSQPVASDIRTAAEVLARLTSGQPSAKPLNLAGANLDHLDLQGADFSKWTLDSLRATEIKLRKANLYGAAAEGAGFAGGDLRRATLNHGRFSGSLFVNANLRGAHAENAVFTKAEMDDCDLAFADLSSANFQNASLRRANFFRADLTGAILRDADLSGARLGYAAGITRAQARTAQWDETTDWPEELEMPRTREDYRSSRPGGRRFPTNFGGTNGTS